MQLKVLQILIKMYNIVNDLCLFCYLKARIICCNVVIRIIWSKKKKRLTKRGERDAVCVQTGISLLQLGRRQQGDFSPVFSNGLKKTKQSKNRRVRSVQIFSFTRLANFI